MNKGVVLFAFNNSSIDYIKQAIYCAKRIKKYLKLPVQLITDNKEYIDDKFPFYKKYIDEVTCCDAPVSSTRTFHDGIYGEYPKLTWANSARDSAYELSIFEKTLVIDTDLLISNDKLLKCFDTGEDFMIAKDYHMVNTEKHYPSLDRLSDKSIPMYWATILYFTKSNTAKTVFDTVQHIKENYNYYRLTYDIVETKFRNDFAFSIAVHMMRGFVEDGHWPKPIPSDMWVSLDKDLLVDIKNDSIQLLAQRDWDYLLVALSDATVHVMNKFSLNNFIDTEFANE
tara:strand:- start:1871 stop:2722 length:852 start_codon:yes stop_codon:yes gene_type:complete